MNITKNVREIYVGNKFINELLNEEFEKRVRVVFKGFDKLFSEIASIYENNEWIKFENKDMYFVKSEHVFIPNLETFEIVNDQEYTSNQDVARYFADEFFGIPAEPMNGNQVASLFFKNVEKNPLVDDEKNIKSFNGNLNSFVTYKGGNDFRWCTLVSGDGKVIEEGGYNSNNIPVHNIDKELSFIDILLQFDLILEDFDKQSSLKLENFKYLYEKGLQIPFNFNALKEFIIVNKIQEIDGVSFRDEDVLNIITEDGIEIKENAPIKDFLAEYFAKTDYERARIEPYNKQWFTVDDGIGHWELWDPKNIGERLITLNEEFIARNPVIDVKFDATVGIDFGTKSTIVVVQDGSEKIVPMRIGMGSFSDKPEAWHYENPTVMEFINVDKFYEDYNDKKGRPFTSWEDIKVSHTAFKNLLDSQNSNSFYSYFYDIKQWAANKKKNDGKVIVKDKTGKRIPLKSYLDITDNDFDPIEIYAYYLGLFINNMRTGIYIDYILSFPETYSSEIKEKIRNSFLKGLKKSLPTEVLNCTDTMEKFRVQIGLSEPTAYAVCALQEYGLEPQNDEKIFYAIFDFGGGTTDFDFGIWRNANKNERRYDYVLEHFGSGGDQYLGGENILELLVYEIFKDEVVHTKGLEGSKSNLDKVRENKIVFTKPLECDYFSGCEVIISYEQNARLNTKHLMEKLRPIWEKTDNYEEILSKGKIKVDLLRETGEICEGLELEIDREKVEKILRRRIEKGVRNFFEAMLASIKDREIGDVEEIHIFLAGNSSKSKIVEELFEEYCINYSFKIVGGTLENTFINHYNVVSKIKAENGESLQKLKEVLNLFLVEGLNTIRDKGFDTSILSRKYMNLDKCIDSKDIDIYCMVLESIPSELLSTYSSLLKKYNVYDILEDERFFEKESNSKKQFFKLYKPLGTKEAQAIQKERGLNVDTNDLIRPTGKTGVAFGLIECREGSKIKVISDNIQDGEIRFNYYVGYNHKKMLNVVINRDVKYNTWVEFVDAELEFFEFYFTTLPESITNKISVRDESVKKKKCQIDVINREANVYIRAVSPNAIEYVVATPQGIKNENYLGEINKVELFD